MKKSLQELIEANHLSVRPTAKGKYVITGEFINYPTMEAILNEGYTFELISHSPANFSIHIRKTSNLT